MTTIAVSTIGRFVQVSRPSSCSLREMDLSSVREYCGREKCRCLQYGPVVVDAWQCETAMCIRWLVRATLTIATTALAPPSSNSNSSYYSHRPVEQKQRERERVGVFERKRTLVNIIFNPGVDPHTAGFALHGRTAAESCGMTETSTKS